MCDRLPQSLEVDIKMQEKENEEEEEDSKDGSRSKGGPKNKKSEVSEKKYRSQYRRWHGARGRSLECLDVGAFALSRGGSARL